MAATKQTALERPAARDPFAQMRQMTSELNRMFEDVGWPGVRWPALRTRPALEAAAWIPQIDVFEKDGRLVTKVDLPGIRKENIKVEVSDGHLIIAGAREAMRHTSKLDVVLLDYSLPDSNDLRFLEEVRAL